MTAMKPPGERDIPAAANAERRARLLAAVDLASPRRHRRPRARLRRVQLGVACGAGAGAIAVVLLTSGGATAPQAADAALLRQIAAALAPPSATIVHERAMIATPGRAAQPFELWAQSDAPHAYRVIKWGHEASWNGSSFSTYDPQTNTVRVSPAGGPKAGRSHQPVDFASSLRALVQSGQARVGGTSRIDGVSAYELSVGSNTDVLPPGSTAFVDASDDRPLVIDYNANGGQTISFEAYEYLPANAVNLSLLNLTAQHPGARVIGRTEEARTTSGRGRSSG